MMLAETYLGPDTVVPHAIRHTIRPVIRQYRIPLLIKARLGIIPQVLCFLLHRAIGGCTGGKKLMVQLDIVEARKAGASGCRDARVRCGWRCCTASDGCGWIGLRGWWWWEGLRTGGLGILPW